jgi:hypothetical protein
VARELLERLYIRMSDHTRPAGLAAIPEATSWTQQGIGAAAPRLGRRRRRAGWPVCAAVAAAAGLSSCDGSQPAEPTPLTFTFSFGADAQPFRPYSMWLEDAREGVANEIAIAVMADFEPDCAVHRIQGTLVYDAGILQAESHSEGTYMQQGGVDAQTTVTLRRGQVSFRIDRPGAASGVSGRGRVITVRFRAAGQTARGRSSPLEWSDAHAYAANFLECLHATRGGDVSVR